MCAAIRPRVKTVNGGEIAKEDVPGPSEENFSLADWAEGVATYPVVLHTVFFDQDGGIQLDAVQKRIAEIETDLEVSKDAGKENPGSKTLVEVGTIAARNARLTKELKALKRDEKALTERVLDSAMTFELKSSEPMSQNKQTDGMLRQLAKERYGIDIPQGDNGIQEFLESTEDNHLATDVMGLYDLARLHVMVSRLVVRKTGAARNGPIEVEELEKLLALLATSERIRLTTALISTINLSGEWAEKLDAGFPG